MEDFGFRVLGFECLQFLDVLFLSSFGMLSIALEDTRIVL